MLKIDDIKSVKSKVFTTFRTTKALILATLLHSLIQGSEHIETMKKITKTLGALYKTRHFLNEKILYLIFNSSLMSIVRYGLLCWGAK